MKWCGASANRAIGRVSSSETDWTQVASRPPRAWVVWAVMIHKGRGKLFKMFRMVKSPSVVGTGMAALPRRFSARGTGFGGNLADVLRY